MFIYDLISEVPARLSGQAGHGHATPSPVAAAYRVLRTNLQFSSLDHPLCTKRRSANRLARLFSRNGHSANTADVEVEMSSADGMRQAEKGD